MSGLVLLHESGVSASEIDTLGHMNVRFYLERMTAANEALLGRAGVNASDGTILRRVDTYTRFLREQFEGAVLQVYGGLVAQGQPDAFNGYYEIRNSGTGDLAATFIVASQLVDAANQSPLPLKEVTSSAADLFIDVPSHGKPRTLELSQPVPVSMEAVAARVMAVEDVGEMVGKREGVVSEEHCYSDGRMREDVDLMFVLLRDSAREEGAHGPPVLKTETGVSYSWAIMENRTVVLKRPKLGDALVSYSGDLASGDKWRHTRRWTFDAANHELLGFSDHVALCMDLDARRAMNIPADIRRIIETNCMPELAAIS